MNHKADHIRTIRLGAAFLICALFALIMLSTALISESHAASSCNVWVDGQEVTDENLSGNGWTYDPDTKTLNLSYATISSTANSSEFSIVARAAYIISHNDVLNLNIIGENHINMANDTYGILCTGTLNITGNGTLDITDNHTFMNDVIFANGAVTLAEKAQILISGGSYGIRSSSLAVNGGLLSIDGTENSAISVSGDITIADDMWITVPRQYGEQHDLSGNTILIEPQDKDALETLDSPELEWTETGVISWDAVEGADRYKVVVTDVTSEEYPEAKTYWIKSTSLDMAKIGRSEFIDESDEEVYKNFDFNFKVAVSAFALDGSRSGSDETSFTIYYMYADSKFADHAYVHRMIGEEVTLTGVDPSHKEYFEKYFDDPVWVLSDGTNTKEISGDSCTFEYGTDHQWKSATLTATPKNVDVTLDTGEGHENLANSLAAALNEKYGAVADGTVVSMQTPVCDSTGNELKSNELVNDIDTAVRNASDLYNGKQYTGIVDENGKSATGYKYIDVLDSGLKLEIHWKEALKEIKIGIELPAVGEEITSRGSQVQSPSPAVTFGDDSVVELKEGAASKYVTLFYANPRIMYYEFIDSEDDRYDRWEWTSNNFTITAGTEYKVELYFGEKSNNDYCIDSSDLPVVHVNGMQVDDGLEFENGKFHLDYDIVAHDWTEVTYTVSDDGKTVTAKRTAKDDASVSQEETTEVKQEITKAPGCETTGTAAKVARFSNPLFETQIIEKDIELPASGHDYKVVKGTEVAATCEKAGKEADQRCSKCGNLVEGAVIPATVHQLKDEKRNEKYATCTEPGYYDLHAVCENCDYEKRTATVITEPALGHDWGDWTETKTATETEEGEETRTCSRCSSTETRTIPKNDHVHDMELIKKKKATCNEDGNIECYQCTKCLKYFSDEAGATELTETQIRIPAIHHEGHLVTVDEEPFIKATCTTSGYHYRVHKCELCGEWMTYRLIKDEPGHTWGSWKTSTPATELSAGRKVRTCTVCGAKETQTIAKLKPTLKTVKITKLKAGKKTAVVSWKKISKKNLKKIKKIQIQYSTDKSFKTGVKTKTVSAKKKSLKLRKLKSKKRYYVRIRAYTKKNGTVHISNWSKIKSKKIK